MLSITEVCPNCKRVQPPYPPVLPGGGGKSYRGWAYILTSIGVGLFIMGVAMYFQSPYSDIAAATYGSQQDYISTGKPVWFQFFGSFFGPVYPGYGYIAFFCGLAIVLFIWAFVSYNRGNKIDKANVAILRSLRRSGNE